MKVELSALNDQQRAAAMHEDGPCLVVAAAGSGKTTMLITRIQHLIEERGIAPTSILACTFTRRAADEMKLRMTKRLDRPTPVIICTLHSLAYRMVMPRLGPDWQVLTDPSWLMEQVLQPPTPFNPYGVGDVMKVQDAVFGIGRAKADGLKPTEVSGTLGKVYQAYESYKQHRKRVDFEDLVIRAWFWLMKDPAYAVEWHSRFRYILVDEFQDTNTIQWQFLMALARRHHNLFAVGDDYQSIYGFRGARPELMQTFLRAYPDTKLLKLTTNYRSHDLIVELSNKVISLNQGHQIEKVVEAARAETEQSVAQIMKVGTDTEEATWIVKEVERFRRKHPDIPLNQVAVLYRTNIQSRMFEEAFSQVNISYDVIGDTHFYERRDVKTILEYLKTAQNHDDPETWTPILNVPKRYLSKSEVAELSAGGWDAVLMNDKCRGFVQIIEQLSLIEKPADAMLWLVENQKGLVRPTRDDDPIRWIDALMSSAKRFDDVQAFLEFAHRMVEQSKLPKSDAVQLMTIHMSKGLEFDTVFVPGMVEGILPHKKSVSDSELREETRLAYVAMTRAKENLYLLAAKMYGDKAMEPSRYLEVLTDG